MKNYNIYLIGVGGQGIGLLSEVLIRAADYSNINVRGVDTHGLAQRGGTVRSFIRLGDNIHSPLIPKHKANLVISLERHEALRGMNNYLMNNGILVYYDAVWQPLSIRLKKSNILKNNTIVEEAKRRNINFYRIYKEDLEDSRMQNIVLLAHIAKNKIIENIKRTNYKKAISDLLKGEILEKNLKLFDSI